MVHLQGEATALMGGGGGGGGGGEGGMHLHIFVFCLTNFMGIIKRNLSGRTLHSYLFQQ